MLLQNILVMIVSLIGAMTDLKSGRIYNKVTYPGIIIGIILGFTNGWSGLFSSLAGLFGAFILYVMFYRLRGVAAGDVKLMAAIGAFKGFPFIIYSSFYILCFACLLGLIVLAWKGRLIPALKWVGRSLISIVIPGFQRPGLESGTTVMPFAPSICLGAAFSIWFEYANGPFGF